MPLAEALRVLDLVQGWNAAVASLELLDRLGERIGILVRQFVFDVGAGTEELGDVGEPFRPGDVAHLLPPDALEFARRQRPQRFVVELDLDRCDVARCVELAAAIGAAAGVDAAADGRANGTEGRAAHLLVGGIGGIDHLLGRGAGDLERRADGEFDIRSHPVRL